MLGLLVLVLHPLAARGPWGAAPQPGPGGAAANGKMKPKPMLDADDASTIYTGLQQAQGALRLIVFLVDRGGRVQVQLQQRDDSFPLERALFACRQARGWPPAVVVLPVCRPRDENLSCHAM